MKIRTYVDRPTMSRAAARRAAHLLRAAIEERGGARIIAATGASQFEFLDALTQASFRSYLLERLVNRTGMTRDHLLDAEDDAHGVAERVGREVVRAPIDVAFVGVGENGHLAFNDPPADFETERPYLVVALDEACRRQQVGEGWFASIVDVPSHAVSMSVRQILKSREIICVVPDARKAEAVRACFDGDVAPMAPASILRTHGNTVVYLDRDSAALLAPSTRGEIVADETP